MGTSIGMSTPAAARNTVTLFLSGDVMTGRGVDQILPHPCAPQLYEPYVSSAYEYVELAERAHGRIMRPLGFTQASGDRTAKHGCQLQTRHLTMSSMQNQ